MKKKTNRAQEDQFLQQLKAQMECECGGVIPDLATIMRMGGDHEVADLLEEVEREIPDN